MSNETRLGDISSVLLGAPHKAQSSSITLPVKVISVGDLGPNGVNTDGQEALELLSSRARKYGLVNDDVIVAVRGTIFKTAIFTERSDSLFVLGPNLARVRMRDPKLALVIASVLRCEHSPLSLKFKSKRSVRASGFVGPKEIEDFLFKIPGDKVLGELITVISGAQEEAQLLDSIILKRRYLVEDWVSRLMLK